MQIDPIVVREELARIQTRQEFHRVRANAATALAWFAEHALSKSSPQIPISGGVLQEDLKPIATSTPGVEAVLPYIRMAYREQQRAIIERAVQLAQADYAKVEDK